MASLQVFEQQFFDRVCNASLVFGGADFRDFGHQKIPASGARKIIFGSKWRSVSFQPQRELLKFLRGAHVFCRIWLSLDLS